MLWFEEESLQIMQADTDNFIYVSVVHLDKIAAAHAINNDYQGTPGRLRFNIYDGFSDTEKLLAMRAGTEHVLADSAITDLATVSATGPWNLAPSETESTAFAYVWADDIDEIRATARAVRNWYSDFKAGIITDIEDEAIAELPENFQLYPAYPNPFNPSTTLRFDLTQNAQVQLEVFDIMGRKVATLVNGRLSAGVYNQSFDASNLSSGLYIARMLVTANDGSTLSRVVKMQLIK